ncbi:hypothetical protein [Streptomyces sp. NPDC048737]|uniref:hypothetical protein n=1 Tax=unclassified Streptomyces TaxID=2593676 RepID=UPI00342E44CF
MRHFPGSLPRRATVGVVALASRRAPDGAPAAPAQAVPETGCLVVVHDGDCGRSGDSLMLSTGARGASAPSGPVDPSDDLPNSAISGPGAAPAARVPAYARTPGQDSDVFDLRAGLRRGGDQPAFRLVPQRGAAWAGGLFVAVGTRKQ